MKKTLIVLFSVFLTVFFFSCSNELGKSASITSSALDDIFVQSYLSRYLDLQVWESTATLELPDDTDTLLVTATSSWLGIALAKSDSYSDCYFNLEGVSYLSVDVKGNIPLDRSYIYLIGLGSAGNDKKLSDCVASGTYSETSFATIRIDLSSMSDDEKERVETLFVLLCENASGEDATFESGQWMEIGNIDFLDDNYQHVDITCAAISYESGSWSSVFKEGTDFLELQVWEDTCTLELRKTGLRVYSKGSSWFGGALASSSGSYADFTNVSKIQFSIRGTMTSSEVKAGFTMIGYDGTKVLYDLDSSVTYDETTYGTYTIDVPTGLTDIQYQYVSQPFSFCQGNTYSGSGYWIEIKDITFLNSSGASIALTPSSISEDSSGTWSTLFSDLDSETDIDLQIWDSTFISYLNSDGLKIIPTGSWAGGGIVNPQANQGSTSYKLFDFTGVVKMEFKIKGTIDPQGLKVYVQKNSYTDSDGNTVADAASPSGSLYDNGVSSITSSAWTSVSLTIQSESDVNYPFTFVTTGNSSYWCGKYFVIKDITYYNSSGDKVTLKYCD